MDNLTIPSSSRSILIDLKVLKDVDIIDYEQSKYELYKFILKRIEQCSVPELERKISNLNNELIVNNNDVMKQSKRNQNDEKNLFDNNKRFYRILIGFIMEKIFNLHRNSSITIEANNRTIYDRLREKFSKTFPTEANNDWSECLEKFRSEISTKIFSLQKELDKLSNGLEKKK